MFKVATQCTFFIVMANNPLEMGQVIPRNVAFECHFSFPLSPFLNTATGKEMRIRSLKPRVPTLCSLVSDSLDDISSLYSAAVWIVLWIIYELTNQSLDYLLFSVCAKRMRIVSSTSMERFMLSLQKRKLLQRAKLCCCCSVNYLLWAVLREQIYKYIYTVFHTGRFPKRVYASSGEYLLVMRPKNPGAYLTRMNSWKLSGL